MTTNPLLRQGKAISAEPNLYEHFGLKENPFPKSPTVNPTSGDPRENGCIYCENLRQIEQTQFERLFVPLPNRPEPRQMAFLMDYATRRGRGIGKTAFLTHQRRRIMQDLGDRLTDGNYVIMASHLVPSGGIWAPRKFWQFVRLISNSLNADLCIATAIWRLRAFSGVIPDSVLADVNQGNLADTLGNDGWLYNREVDVLFTLNQAVLRALTSVGIHEEIAEKLAQFGHSPLEFEKQFLRHCSDPWWRQEGYAFVFDQLARLFEVSSINRVLLLVDEVEKIVVNQNRNERTAFVDDVRRCFVDGAFTSVRNRTYGVLWTIHPYVQEIWRPYWHSAGLDRICPIGGATSDDFTVYFYPMKPDEAAIPLVQEYMDFYRLDTNSSGSLTPFSEGAVIAALEKSDGLPGPMLTLLRIALDRAVQDKRAVTGLEVGS